jgi:carbon storage regulator
MLILSREKDESIIIRDSDDRIVVTIVAIRGDKVRLGITAPKHVEVNREEIDNRIHTEEVESRDQKQNFLQL